MNSYKAMNQTRKIQETMLNFKNFNRIKGKQIWETGSSKERKVKTTIRIFIQKSEL